MTPEFVPGLELAQRYFTDIVEPVLTQVQYSAALIGAGSEVLGFDTERSRDHDWGPRLLVFLESDPAPVLRAVESAIPEQFLGYRTRFVQTDGPAKHGIHVVQLDDWLRRHLGFDPRLGMDTADWLALPTQRLAEITAGGVFHDDLGLNEIRRQLEWYPEDVWRFILLCQWTRIGQEIAFAGRCAEVGDELGSIVVASRLVRDLIRLNLLMERRYPPYSKWLGTAFSRLQVAEFLEPVLRRAMTGSTWTDREDELCRAYEFTARRHNELGLTAPLPTSVTNYFDRPIRVIDTSNFVNALRATISDPWLRNARPIGAVDNFIDSTDAMGSHRLLRAAIEAQRTTRRDSHLR